jgi:predicted NBD/HSP70 family sugar kinase
MRRFNASATLRLFVHTDGPLTSAELVERTGLSRRTIELIVADLIADGWVREVDPPVTISRAGRPKKFFELVPERGLLLSVEIDDDIASAVISDIRGRVLGRSELRSQPGAPASELLRRAMEAVDGAVSDVGCEESRLRAVVVGISGTVNEDGVLLTSPAGADWEGLDIRRPFAERFPTTVVVENSTNLIALAEQWSGAARDTTTFVLLTPGNRIAAGVVIGGEVYRGFEGAAGELVRIEELALARWSDHPVAMITSPNRELRDRARSLIASAGEGDEAAVASVEEFFYGVARLIGVVGWMLAPPVIVLGGDFRGVEAVALRFVSAALDQVDAPHVEVRVAQHGEDAALIGGISLARDLAEGELFEHSAR